MDEEGTETVHWTGFWFGFDFLDQNNERITIYYGPGKHEMDRVNGTEEPPTDSSDTCGVFVGIDNWENLKELDYNSSLALQILSAIEHHHPKVEPHHNPLGRIQSKIRSHNQIVDTDPVSAPH